MAEFEMDLSELVLIPSRGGVFEVELDGESVHSKRNTGRHAEHDDVLAALRKLISR